MVGSLDIRRRLVPFLMVLLAVLWMQPTMAAGAQVRVEALGFFSHGPMQETADTINQVCAKFGNRVKLVEHDETTDDGIKFMQDKGLSGHLPMLIYVNGSLAHKIGNREVVFRDFVGQGWTGNDLEQVIKLNLGGVKTAVPAPPNADTEQWNPSAIPTGATSSQGATPTSTMHPPTALFYTIICIVVGIAVVQVITLTIVFILWRRLAKRG